VTVAGSTLTRLLRYDRLLVLAALLAVVALAWAYLLFGAGIEMDQMDMGNGAIMLMTPPWTPGYALLIFLMWSIMMAAMMLPSAAPTILLVATLARSGAGRGTTASLFSLGYILVWTAFSVAAAALQWGLDTAGVLSPTMAVANASVAGVVLIAAGIYQWTPFKQACLLHCRSPIAYLLNHWHRGALGAMANGMRHGTFCLGCCWMLMLLLFVGGVMNLFWIAALALLVLLEKTLPWGGNMSRVTGLVMVGWGVVMLTTILGTGGSATG
jgi:predicted metal-binding membrane protein